MRPAYSSEQIQAKLQSLAAVAPARSRVSSGFAKALLLSGGGYFRDGIQYAVYSKSIGAGVYEIWAEIKK